MTLLFGNQLFGLIQRSKVLTKKPLKPLLTTGFGSESEFYLPEGETK
jgi:hypothetical protein